jgi:ribosomal protein S2
MTNYQEIEEKMKQLRVEYKNATEEDREIIKRRALALKNAKEKLKQKEKN